MQRQGRRHTALPWPPPPSSCWLSGCLSLPSEGSEQSRRCLMFNWKRYAGFSLICTKKCSSQPLSRSELLSFCFFPSSRLFCRPLSNPTNQFPPVWHSGRAMLRTPALPSTAGFIYYSSEKTCLWLTAASFSSWKCLAELRSASHNVCRLSRVCAPTVTPPVALKPPDWLHRCSHVSCLVSKFVYFDKKDGSDWPTMDVHVFVYAHLRTCMGLMTLFAVLSISISSVG